MLHKWGIILDGLYLWVQSHMCSYWAEPHACFNTERASTSGLRGWRVSRIQAQDFAIVLEDSLTLGIKEFNEIFVWMYMLIWWEMICSMIFYMLCDSVSGAGDLLACVIKPLVWREQVGLPCIALADTLWLMKEGHFSSNSCSSMFQLADSHWWPKNTTTKNNISIQNLPHHSYWLISCEMSSTLKDQTESFHSLSHMPLCLMLPICWQQVTEKKMYESHCGSI